MLVPSKKIKFSTNPTISLGGVSMTYVDSCRYLGCILSCDWSDDLDINRQRRAVVIRVNSLLRTFYKCSGEVKSLLFNTYCSNMYCTHLWTSHKKSSLYNLKISYHNALRKMFGLRRDCSAGHMFVSRILTGFDALRRKYTYRFQSRLSSSNNCIIKSVVSSSWWLTACSLGSHMYQMLYVKYMY